MKNRNYFSFERNRYFYGKLLTVRDFETEQKYFNDKRRLINRVLHGAGIVCGLETIKTDDATLSIDAGVALDYLGREIVVDTPVTRKLSMLEGFDRLQGERQAYLCLQYAESLKEPVNSVGAEEEDKTQYNKIEETYRLYLDTQEPDIESILSIHRDCNVQVLFSKEDVKILQITPHTVLPEEEFKVSYMVMKGIDSPLVSFQYSFHSQYFRASNDENRVNVEFHESPNMKKAVYVVNCVLKSEQVRDIPVVLNSRDCALKVKIGDWENKIENTRETQIYIAGEDGGERGLLHYRKSLEKQTEGGETPIYLARIDLIRAEYTYIVNNVYPVPFEQYAGFAKHERIQTSDSGVNSGSILTASTQVKMLKSWQKPEADVRYNAKTGNLNFQFGFPSTEAYDYATSSGVAEIPLGSGIRVNSRCVSEEIPHNLGLGPVGIILSIEYDEGEKNEENAGKVLLFGNGDIFSKKNGDGDVPKIESAALLYPEKGTFKIGLRLLDYVDGLSVRVRWFAFKPTRDSAEMKIDERISIRIEPDIGNVKPRERIHFKAVVVGTDNKNVIWSVREKDGGSIDKNGIYKAPSTAGTYEITAESVANPECKASAFVVVEES